MPFLRKSLQSLFVETVLIISLFTLVGHLSVNFWERYVVQNELSQMKLSLHSLKDTINGISTAYQKLHKELHTLADEAVKENYIIGEPPPSKFEKTTHYSALAQNILEDIQFRSMVDNSRDSRKIQAEVTQTIANEDTQTDLNQTTSYNPPPILKPHYKDENVGEKGFHNKKIQHITRMETRNKHNVNNIDGMSSKKSLKSISASTKLNEIQDSISPHQSDKCYKYYVQKNVYKSKNNNCCSAVDEDYPSYLTF